MGCTMSCGKNIQKLHCGETLLGSRMVPGSVKDANAFADLSDPGAVWVEAATQAFEMTRAIKPWLHQTSVGAEIKFNWEPGEFSVDENLGASFIEVAAKDTRNKVRRVEMGGEATLDATSSAAASIRAAVKTTLSAGDGSLVFTFKMPLLRIRSRRKEQVSHTHCFECMLGVTVEGEFGSSGSEAATTGGGLTGNISTDAPAGALNGNFSSGIAVGPGTGLYNIKQNGGIAMPWEDGMSMKEVLKQIVGPWKFACARNPKTWKVIGVRVAEAIPEDLALFLGAGKDEELILFFVGNPGAGKSTLANSLAMEKIFTAKIGAGSGVTSAFDIQKRRNLSFFDTPGLSDKKKRVEAAKAISDALKTGGSYKICFPVVLQQGRARPEDELTVRLVIEAAPDISDRYGIIFNQCSKEEMRLSEEDEEWRREVVEVFLSGIPSKTTHVHFMAKDDKLDGKANVIQELPRSTKIFLQALPIVRLKPDVAKDISPDGFDELAEQVAEQQRLVMEHQEQNRKQKQENDELERMKRNAELIAQAQIEELAKEKGEKAAVVAKAKADRDSLMADYDRELKQQGERATLLEQAHQAEVRTAQVTAAAHLEKIKEMQEAKQQERELEEEKIRLIQQSHQAEVQAVQIEADAQKEKVKDMQEQHERERKREEQLQREKEVKAVQMAEAAQKEKEARAKKEAAEKEKMQKEQKQKEQNDEHRREVLQRKVKELEGRVEEKKNYRKETAEEESARTREEAYLRMCEGGSGRR